MKSKTFYSGIALILLLTACGGNPGKARSKIVDGKVKNGLREIIIPRDGEIKLTVYRGDYIIPVNQENTAYTVSIPELGIKKNYPVKAGDKKYIKMKKLGTYFFSIGNQKGSISVVEYKEPHYRSVSSDTAVNIIKNINPLILDVRTPMEFNMIRIPGAKLIPLQVLQENLAQLEDYREKDILIYCATGNRSTVASKILIDAGFKRIYNMRFGIAQWKRLGYETLPRKK